MPLMKTNDYNGRELPYDVKLQIVEQNCSGCPFFMLIEDPETVEPQYGCVYAKDMEQFNLVLRENYLTVSEIASNTCEFWNFWQRYQRVVDDWTPEDWADFCSQPSELTYVMDRKVVHQSGPNFNDEYDHIEQTLIIPQLHFSEDCGVRY